MRKILHVDMDAFYASVEQRDDAALRGRPVAVGGRHRGVVTAASYEARPFGVRSAMPMAQALKLCPDLVVVPPRFEVYRAVSAQVRAVFSSYTDLVEPLSLDEAYLDVTAPKQGPPSATLLAQAIRADIREATGLPASAGVSFGKFLAKMASGLAKPDGLHVIPPAEALAFLAALPVEDFHGVGPATARRLHALGLRTGADLVAYGERALQSRLGRVGRHLHRIARGDDTRPVRPHRVRKSVGVERTFGRDLRGEEALVERLTFLADALARRLARHEQAGRTLTLKIKDARFQVTTRRTTTEAPVWEAADLLGLAVALLHRPAVPDARVRLLGLTVSTLVPRDAVLGRQLAFAFAATATS